MCALCLQLNRRSGLLLGFAQTLRSRAARRSQTRSVAPPPLLATSAEILGVRIPDTDVAVAATDLAQSAMAPSPSLFNHCRRTFVLGMLNARKIGLKVDEEAGYVASILHDIALVPGHAGDLTKTFERNGAELAQAFVLRHGFSADRADKVFQAILLHASQAAGHGPDVEFVMQGAGEDLFGEHLNPAEIAAVEGAIPRLRFKEKFLALMQDHVRRTKQPGWTKTFVSGEDGLLEKFLQSPWSE
jgi:hypothetical protein